MIVNSKALLNPRGRQLAKAVPRGLIRIKDVIDSWTPNPRRLVSNATSGLNIYFRNLVPATSTKYLTFFINTPA